MPNLRNAWDFVRFGTLDSGEGIVATDPPEKLFLQVHGFIDRFTVTFDAANYVYLDEITVESTIGTAPTVIATRRRELDGPDTVEFLLNQPIFPQGTTTFTFDDGLTSNTVSFHYAPDDEDADHCAEGDDTIDEDDNGVPDCVGNIPTVSAWGLVVLTLCLLVAGKVFFSRRGAVA